MRLAAVRVEMPTNAPVVLLQETQGMGRTLPIFIGTPEATAIAYAVQKVQTPRPMTHDLLRDVVAALGAEVRRVVVTELRHGTYYAEVHLGVGERVTTVSARPSDAIALAVRTGATIYAEDDLLDAEGVLLAPDDDDDQPDQPDELVDQFHEFIEGVSPEDFASGPTGEGER